MQAIQFGTLSARQQQILNVRPVRMDDNKKPPETVTIRGGKAMRILGRLLESKMPNRPVKGVGYYIKKLNLLAKAMQTAGYTPTEIQSSKRVDISGAIAGKQKPGRNEILAGPELQMVSDALLNGLMNQLTSHHKAKEALGRLMEADTYVMPEAQFDRLLEKSETPKRREGEKLLAYLWRIAF